MALRDDCIASAVARDVDGDALAPGALLETGTFLHNQEEAHPRYGEPEPEPFGYTLKPAPHDWGWTHGDGLSANLESCIRTPTCSLCVHPNPGSFAFVVRFTLEGLSAAVQHKLIAKFTPVEEEEGVRNPCHFDIYPDTARIDDVRVALRRLANFPPKLKPMGPSREQAKKAAETFAAVFTVIPVDPTGCEADADAPATTPTGG